MSGYKNEGGHVGRARSSANPVTFRAPTPVQQQAAPSAAPATNKQATARKRIFLVEVWGSDPPPENPNIESAAIERALQLAVQSFRSRVGLVLNGTILDDGAVPVGHWRYEPSEGANKQ